MLLSVLVALAVPPLGAQGAGTSIPPDVIVLISPLDEGTEPFGQVIAEAARYKLRGAGLEPKVDVLIVGQKADPLQRTAADGASAALVCTYQQQGGQIAVHLEWVEAGAPVASTDARGDLDLHVDGVIFAAVDELLGKVHDRVAAIGDRGAAARRNAMPGTSQGVAANPASPASPGSAVEAQPAGSMSQEPARPAGIPARAAAQPARLRLLLSGGFAPFVPAGAASSYFSLGYLPSVLASLLVPTRAGPVGVGLYTGLDYFSAVGLIDTSTNYLIPIGVDLRYELDLGSFRPFFHFSGGPAVLVIATASQGTAVDVLPFIKSGIGLEYRINAWLGLSIAADYDIYFEMPFLIMGWSPSANLAVRL